MTPRDDINERIRERFVARRRDGLKLSLAELAHTSGVDERWLARFEAGQEPMRVDCLPALAKALHVSIDWLVVGEEAVRPEFHSFMTTPSGHKAVKLGLVDMLLRLPTPTSEDDYRRVVEAVAILIEEPER